MNIYTIAAGKPFAATLARALLAETRGRPEDLSRYRILLPTRRGCRTLREAFLNESEGRALLLPRMAPIGDIDEEELSLSLAGHDGLEGMLDLPPSISAIRRQMLLARTILARPDFEQGVDHALALAQALGTLIDQVYTENLDLADLETLVPERFAQHWQVTLDFLRIIAEAWPDILADQGCIDRADRRNRLILSLAGYWADHPPDTPVIAAGSTGSIPATAQLMKTIAALPQGKVILPGVDTQMDPADWGHMEEHHPQYGYRQLCSRLGCMPNDIPEFAPDQPDDEISRSRRALASEFMRPAPSTQNWSHLHNNYARSLENLSISECETEEQEAAVIALRLRQTLQTPGKQAVLVTPDRALAARVTAQCTRWGITLDDSAGKALDETPPGAFLSLALAAMQSDLAPVALLSLLKNDLTRAGLHYDTLRRGVAELEYFALRGLKPRGGITG